MMKFAYSLLLFLLPSSAFGQANDTFSVGWWTFVCHDKFEKRPEPAPTFKKFMSKTLRFPDEAKEGGLQGKVYVQFTVSETGEVVNPTIIESPHKCLSDEVLRLVGIMPSWSPATIGGKPIRVALIMPITFKLE